MARRGERQRQTASDRKTRPLQRRAEEEIRQLMLVVTSENPDPTQTDLNKGDHNSGPSGPIRQLHK